MDRLDRPMSPEEEGRLSELFEALTPPLEDDGFSAIVVRRIRRRRWVRRAVLSTAALVGGALALGPLSELSVLLAELPVHLSEVLVTVATSWNDPAWLTQNRLILIMAVLAASIPGAIRLLDR